MGYLMQCVQSAQYGQTESVWLEWIKYHNLQLKAKEIACNVDDDKAVKHAIKLLLDEGILTNTATSISGWLHCNRYDIPASNLGDFIGGSRPKSERPLEEEIRCCYMRHCDLNFYAPIEILMKYFLTKCGFRLPSEAQKIERVLESFAYIYYCKRSEIWEHPDAVFVVFNAILMLNTSLHNPRIKEKDKLKKNVFLGMCLNVKGQNFTSSDYERVYNYIANNAYEIKFEDEEKQHSTKRQYDEWCKKSLLNGRRPLVAYTQELQQEMKKLKIVPFTKSKSMMMSGHFSPTPTPTTSTPSVLNKSYTFANVTWANPDRFIDFSEEDMDRFIGHYTATAGGPDDDRIHMDGYTLFGDEEFDIDASMEEEKEEKIDDIFDDDEDDDIDVDDEQKEIEKAMRETFEQHSISSLVEYEKEYFTFCQEIESKAFVYLSSVCSLSSDLTQCPQSKAVELGCLLIDNWWSRILDALKIVFELADDPYTTPLVLSILPNFLQITLTLGAFGHSPCKIAFNGILQRYTKWWLSAIKRMEENTKSLNPKMAKESDLKYIEGKIWDSPQKCYENLKKYILASQHVIHSRSIYLRLRTLQFEFSDVHFMKKDREFIGEQTILKLGARDTTYRLFFFSDMLLYANGRPGKYRSHRVLLLIFCALEDLKDSKNVKNAFRIHSPQKAITIALPNNEYKRICFKKINELIVKQRKKIRLLIHELLKKNQKDQIYGDKFVKLANKYQSSSAFLHQTMDSIVNNKNPLPNNCKLCLSAFNRMNRRKKECPICNDYVCPKCIQRKALKHKSQKRQNVCDGCLDIVEGRLKL